MQNSSSNKAFDVDVGKERGGGSKWKGEKQFSTVKELKRSE
jgi:hypothetical protein